VTNQLYPAADYTIILALSHGLSCSWKKFLNTQPAEAQFSSPNQLRQKALPDFIEAESGKYVQTKAKEGMVPKT
jgi:hypothetical protein